VFDLAQFVTGPRRSEGRSPAGPPALRTAAKTGKIIAEYAGTHLPAPKHSDQHNNDTRSGLRYNQSPVVLGTPAAGRTPSILGDPGGVRIGDDTGYKVGPDGRWRAPPLHPGPAGAFLLSRAMRQKSAPRSARSRPGRPMAVGECFQADETVTLAVLALAWLTVTHAFADVGQPSASRSAGLISKANKIPHAREQARLGSRAWAAWAQRNTHAAKIKERPIHTRSLVLASSPVPVSP
jgi:hypothetical protein